MSLHVLSKQVTARKQTDQSISEIQKFWGFETGKQDI